MSDWVKTFRGVVLASEYDASSYMNSRMYVSRFDQATWLLLHAIGLTPATMKERHLRVAIVRQNDQLMRELRGGEVDLALVEAPAAAWAGLPPGLVAATPVHDDSLVLVVGPDHPLARRAAVAATDLAGLPFVGREAGSGTRDVIEEALRAAGVTLEVRHELGEPEAIKLAVRSGLGVTILSSVAVRAEVERGELAAVPIDHPGFARRFTLLHPPEGLASHAAWAFRTLATAAVTPRRQAPPTPGRRAAR